MELKALKAKITPDDIINILRKFGVEPVDETDEFIIFPTCCHNRIEDGGKPKLYYYKNTSLFHCYTECSDSFDIFELIMRMEALKGHQINIREAVMMCGLSVDIIPIEEENKSCLNDIRYMEILNDSYIVDLDKVKLTNYDESVLNRFSFNYLGLMSWIQEGISIETLQTFNIKYDEYRNGIIIPNFDYDGNLIGIRERFLKDKDIEKGKYRPFYDNGILYKHPTSKTFYGIHENHRAIERKKMCIIFEGEKSVLKYGTIYGNDNNIALATLGQHISKEHLQYLLKMGVNNIILAYDADYNTIEERKAVEKNYVEKGKILSPYFNVSILMDYENLLPYKASPIDNGKETFERILKNRRVIY